MEDLSHRPGLEDAYSVETPEDNKRLYGEWAETYDESFISATGYVYHRRVAEVFADEYSGTKPVLDVGCGTGVVGWELRKHGIAKVDGIDISEAMLDIARTKTGPGGTPIYRKLIEADLTGPIELRTDTYGGVVSAGTFTHGHLGPGSIDELIRLTHSGGILVVGVNSAHFDELGFREHLDSLVSRGLTTDYRLVEAMIYDSSDASVADDMSLIVVLEVV